MKKLKEFSKGDFTNLVNDIVKKLQMSKLNIARKLGYKNPTIIYYMIRNNRTKSIFINKKKYRYLRDLLNQMK